jgi:hypothetical protein
VLEWQSEAMPERWSKADKRLIVNGTLCSVKMWIR